MTISEGQIKLAPQIKASSSKLYNTAGAKSDQPYHEGQGGERALDFALMLASPALKMGKEREGAALRLKHESYKKNHAFNHKEKNAIFGEEPGQNHFHNNASEQKIASHHHERGHEAERGGAARHLALKKHLKASQREAVALAAQLFANFNDFAAANGPKEAASKPANSHDGALKPHHGKAHPAKAGGLSHFAEQAKHSNYQNVKQNHHMALGTAAKGEVKFNVKTSFSPAAQESAPSVNKPAHDNSRAYEHSNDKLQNSANNQPVEHRRSSKKHKEEGRARSEPHQPHGNNLGLRLKNVKIGDKIALKPALNSPKLPLLNGVTIVNQKRHHGLTSLRLQLHPANLGVVHVKMHLSRGVMRINLMASHQQMSERLARDRLLLKNILAKLPLHDHKLNVAIIDKNGVIIADFSALNQAHNMREQNQPHSAFNFNEGGFNEHGSGQKPHNRDDNNQSQEFDRNSEQLDIAERERAAKNMPKEAIGLNGLIV